MKRNEAILQEFFAGWLTNKGVLFCASAGGMRTKIRTAIRMKKMGYKKGFPDIIIYEPRGNYCGMAIELKVDNYPSKEQTAWKDNLLARGYYAVIMPSMQEFDRCLGWLQEEVDKYLKLPVHINQ